MVQRGAAANQTTMTQDSTTGPLLGLKNQNQETGERTAELRANLYIEGDLDVNGQITQNGAPLEAGGALPYTAYVALLTQSGTNAPVATVLENTLGGTPVWARGPQGIYTATLSGAFVIGKTFVLITANAHSGLASVFCYTFPSANVMQLRTFDDTMTAADDLMTRASIEIRVYP